MKIIHLSDPHISPDKLFEHDAKERFSLALQHICNNHLDSKLFVISGDLTHDGDNESYNKLNEILLNSKIPKHLFPKLLIGNHDDREQFKQIFTKIPLDENGFIQYFEDIEDKRFIFLDTNLSNTHQGHFCNNRQSWLINTLENASDNNKQVYLFMHHNPLPLGEPTSDYIGLQQGDEFKDILIKFKKIIQHIFFGHQHITVSGNYLNIPFSAPRSTWSPLVPNFSKNYRLGTANTDPNYNVILINKNSLVVHTEDFLKDNINWFETTKKF